MGNIRVRVDQRNAIKVVASNKAPEFAISDSKDVDTSARTNNSVLIYNNVTNEYVHVTPADLADLIDGVDDDEIDFGEW